MMQNTQESILVATVGTGRGGHDIASAIALSARQNQAGKVLLLSSPNSSAQTVGLIRQRIDDLEIREHVSTAGQENDVQELLMNWSHHWDEWLGDWVPARIVVDFTSGTKPMSAAAFALAISRQADAVSYVVGPRDTTGRATESTEAVSFAPELVLAHRQLRMAAEHFNAGSYAAARDVAEQYLKLADMPDDKLREQARGVHYIAAAYEAWDRFDWKHAAHNFRQVEREWPGWTWVDSPEQLAANYELVRTVEADRKGSRYSTAMLADLLGNIDRCCARSDWDDAVARLYRACELTAQKVLFDAYGQASGNIAPEKLPSGLQQEYRERKPDGGPLKLGLKSAYRLLDELGDRLGSEFYSRYGRDKPGPLCALLARRNDSLLAHGIQPIDADKARDLRVEVKSLAEIACGQELTQRLDQTRTVRLDVR